jgi:amino-acid N-acetyltransferase
MSKHADLQNATAGVHHATHDVIQYRQATPDDADMSHAILRPSVSNHKLFARTEAEVVELTRHGFIAHVDGRPVGFAAVEVYSRKLAEVQCLAVRSEYQGRGIGKELVGRCVQRARELGVVEVMAISSSEDFLKQCGFDYSLPDQKRALFYQLQPRHPDE